MSPLIVVGAGVSGAHCALTLLERGFPVELWDVGREEAPFPPAGLSFDELKHRLDDPASYFLGADLGGLIPPGVPELLRYPPSRRFLLDRQDEATGFACDGFEPFVSFAKGGLANGWGANALSYDANDIEGWPLAFSELDVAYRTVYRRVPVAGPAEDDLSPHLAGVYPEQTPVELTDADHRLLGSYRRRRAALAAAGVKLGLARLAVVTDRARRDACDLCNRCLWGCPRGAIYNPASSTLEACERHPGYRYVPGRQVLALRTRDGAVIAIRYRDADTTEIREQSCGTVFLAAGALQTGAIFLRTLARARQDIATETDGLMDTTVVKIPFVALRSVGSAPPPRAFQFNRLILGLTDNPSPWPAYLHGELLHLTSLVYHPLIERMPFDSRTSSRLFFALRPALGVVTLFFPDRIHPGNRQVLTGTNDDCAVRLSYREPGEKAVFVRQAIARVRSALWQLGCVPRPAVTSPAGGGIHYAGTVPMGGGPKRCGADGRSNLFRNLYIADGAAFPSLPSKSITMSLAAHATRVAQQAAA
jgi:choline dehydrogenase-like flavoprotein